MVSVLTLTVVDGQTIWKPKWDYNGYGIYDIYSYKGDCKFDVVILSGLDDGFPQVGVNHYNKTVSPLHGYMGRGKELAKRLGYKYHDI